MKKGRPRKPLKDKLNRIVLVCFKKDEVALVDKRRRKESLDRSPWIRREILEF